ncbi:MAG: cupredoxin domain-containing protein [Nitrosotalea sp.]
MKTLHITIIVILIMGISYVTDKSAMGYGFCCARTSSEPYMPPLKQFESGTDLVNIKCNNDLQPVVRYHDLFPLCIKFSNIHNIMNRGIDLLVFANESQTTNLTVTGLKDIYQIDEPINFTVHFKGDSLSCSYPHVFITYSDGRIVWANQPSVMLCDPQDAVQYRELQWNVGQNGDVMVHNNAGGGYGLIVFWNGEVLRKDLSINSNISVVTIPKGFSEHKATFEPKTITVQIGTNETVRWINNDDSETSIISDNSDDRSFYDVTRFDSALRYDVMPGKYFDYGFTTPGEFGYHDTSGYNGTVRVLPPVYQAIGLQIQHPSGERYSNDQVAMPKGAWVTWDNIDNVAHTITSDDNGKTFDSGLVKPRMRFTLDTMHLSPGYYYYHDDLNPELKGSIRIIPSMPSDDGILIKAAKNLTGSKLFLEKHPDAQIRVQHDYHDAVDFMVEWQLYPSSQGYDNTRTLELEVSFDKNQHVQHIGMGCLGPISAFNDNVTWSIQSNWCFQTGFGK